MTSSTATPQRHVRRGHGVERLGHVQRRRGPPITVSYAARSVSVSVYLDGVAHSGESGELDKVMVDVENVVGGTAGDTIVGSALDNVLDGGAGADTISGGLATTRSRAARATTRSTATPATRFDMGTGTSGNDTINGGAGVDTVDYSGRTNAVVIVLDRARPAASRAKPSVIALDVENAVGGAGADTITGNAATTSSRVARASTRSTAARATT